MSFRVIIGNDRAFLGRYLHESFVFYFLKIIDKQQEVGFYKSKPILSKIFKSVTSTIDSTFATRV